MTALSIKNLTFSYGDQDLLRDLSMEVQKGDLALLLGENGSGKSTLLKCILGLLPYQGQIKIFDQEVKKNMDLSSISYVPQQGDQINLSFPINVLEYVLLGLYQSFNFFKQPSRTNKARALDLLEDLGLASLAGQPVQTLSGGQRQRVFIAQALVKNPRLLILDEPTVGIDAHHLASFKELLAQLRGDRDLTILMVTHDPDFKNLPDAQVYMLSRGVLSHG
ncbi:hypothetical protein HMPREF1633_08870 [Tissierellia bacterium S5-A11]|nr:hypothetical protein HMPREF1633_08870 [Tissierellia bacterium S5-A11]